MKGQWYIVTAVLFSFSLLTFFNVFECYSGVDFTSVIENDEDLVALNLMENLNLTIENSEYMENVGADIGDLFEMFERNLVGRGYFFDYNYTTDGGINITKLTIRGTNLKISYILPVCGNGILDFGEECENLTDCSISDFPYRNCTRNRECANCECEGYLDCSGSTCFKGSPDYCAYCDHCEDGTQNCDEDGVDCGGSKCSPCTTQNCTPGTCNTTTRKYCLPDGNWSIQDSTEYCNNCDHCGDGVWNCDESGVDCGGNDCLSCSTQNCTLQGGTCCTGGQTCNGIILMASDCYSPDICCDGTCESLTSCTPETCNTTTRRYCLSGGNWSAQDSTEYCTNCTHCPDGSCNCEENCSTCSSDCGSCSSLPGWDYRKPITLTENSGNSLIDYQVKINVTYDFDMQPDFDDLRFTNFDGTKNLSYWLESKSDSNWADVWVKVDSLPESYNTIIYMYYGNSSVSSISSLADTFFSSSFTDTFIDGTKINSTDSENINVDGGEVNLLGSCSNTGSCVGCADSGSCGNCAPAGCNWNPGSCSGSCNCLFVADCKCDNMGCGKFLFCSGACSCNQATSQSCCEAHSCSWNSAGHCGGTLSCSGLTEGQCNSCTQCFWSYSSIGTLISVTIPENTFQRIAVGTLLFWTDTKPIGTDIKYHIEYFSGTSWQLIPDTDLSGNSAGFDTSPVNIYSIKSDYGQIRLKAALSTTNTLITPSVQDWTVTYHYRKYASPEPTYIIGAEELV